MFASTKNFLKTVRNYPLKFLGYFFMLAMMATALIQFKSRHESEVITYLSENYSPPLNPDNATNTTGMYLELCGVTNQVLKLRELRKTSGQNPARHVVEELLQLVTYDPDYCAVKEDSKNERLAVIFVESARPNLQARQVIRRTWGSLKSFNGWRIRMVFLLGQSRTCLNGNGGGNKWEETVKASFLEEKMLMDEQQVYGDLVIGAFADTYRNLTYKTLTGYKFVQEVCPNAEFIIKTDDDIFLELPAVLDMRSKELKQRSHERIYDTYCLERHNEPRRSRKGSFAKWFVTREEWPGDTYPSYCVGNGHAITMDWIKRIYSVRGEGGFHWLEDVFIMGVLRNIAEHKFDMVINRFNLNVELTDRRRSPSFVKENWDKEEAEIGWLVVLKRTKEHFVEDMELLWRRALKKANFSAEL